MIDFKPICLEAKDGIDKLLKGNPYRSSDLTFTNLYAWEPLYKTHIAFVQDTLFIKYTDTGDMPCYMMPIGKLPLYESLRMIISDANERGVDFQMRGITELMWNQINAAMPDSFGFIPDRDNFEYVYPARQMITLFGSKLQGKRNHINRFKAAYPEWSYSPLVSDRDINDCMDMLNKWEEAAPQGLMSYHYDYIAAKIMLLNFRYLQLKGGIIRIGSQTAAFTIGEPLSNDTFVVHVEKAFADINGAYAVINQQFAENEASQYLFINREEDVGLENLRTAKMSYRPCMLMVQGIVKPVME